MNCRQFDEQLEDYLDSVLPDAAAEEMRRHSAACTDCSDRMRQWAWVRETARGLPAVEAQPDLEMVLRRRLRQQKPSFSWLSRLLVPRFVMQTASIGLLGMVIGSVLFYLFYPVGPSGTQPVGTTAGGMETAAMTSAEPTTTLFREPEPLRREEYPVATPVAVGMPGTAGNPMQAGRFPETYSVNENGEYVEYLLKGTGREEILVRMPKVIRVNPPVDNDQGYFRYISH